MQATGQMGSSRTAPPLPRRAPGASPRLPSRDPASSRAQPSAVLGALLLLAALAEAATTAGGDASLGWAALIGAAAGFALHRAGFGFASAWRRMARERRSAGIRAQIALLGATCLVAWPLLQWGGEVGLEVRGYILPVGLASAFGAALFGAGMQLGGGCASGTLYAAGGGSAKMALTLAAFVAGSALGTVRWDLWEALPRTGRGFSAPVAIGVLPALVLLGILLAAAWTWATAAERRRHGAIEPLAPPRFAWRAPWTPLAGALALAAVAIACLVALGRPWGITTGFALWGTKIAQALGAEPAAWGGGYWTGWRAEMLAAPVLADATSVMNIGILLGAAASAGLAGRFVPGAPLARRDALGAVAGGLMMGVGARLAFGCNIGALLGGFASGSLHGLWWLVFAVPGSLAGGWLRIRLGMDPPVDRGTSGAAP